MMIVYFNRISGMLKNCMLLLALLAVWELNAQSITSGYVFVDQNNNGKKEKKEAGIAGVPVSNGREVVVTDNTGHYNLPVGNDNILFVIKPFGYKTAPVFYHIHKPGGSPSTLQYKGVVPTGSLPVSVDFPLEAYPEPDKFTSVVFGDPQPYNVEEIAYFRQTAVEEVKKRSDQFAFGISLGDLVWDDLSLNPHYLSAIQTMNIPWYHVMGNHDMNYDVKADSLSDETFEATYGPANYAFNYGQAHFLILDDIIYPDPRDGKGYWGGFRQDQIDFIRNDLELVKKDRLIVVALHIPLVNEGGTSFNLQYRQQLFDLLKDFSNVLILSAHTHTQNQNFFTKAEGWAGERPLHEYNVGTTCGDWNSGQPDSRGIPVATMRDGTPRGYALLDIEQNRYKIRYKVIGKPEDYQVELFCPMVVPKDGRRTSANLYANFFTGKEGDKVECRVDGGDWKPMDYSPTVDPAFFTTVFRWDTSEQLLPGRRPSNPAVCTHLWRTPVPNRLPLGEHVVEVRATNMYGATFKTQTSYRVE